MSEVFNMLGSYKQMTIRTKEGEACLYDLSQRNVLTRYEISMSIQSKAHLYRSKHRSKANEHNEMT